MTERLSQEAWVAAGFASLADAGPKAIQVNALATRLGTTKGSFYWHFKDLAAYKSAMLTLWQTKVATEVMAEIPTHDTPRTKLSAVMQAVITPPPDDYGGGRIETAMRAWALSDGDVADALARLDQMRLGFITELLNDLGGGASRFAPLVYAAYIGLDDLASRGHVDAPAGFAVLHDMILSAVDPD
jgi:AcrR family transcriptional regulator